MKVLVLDVGGNHVKVYATGRVEPLTIDSGRKMTPRKMVKAVLAAVDGWRYDVVSIGYPGPAMHGKPLRDPANLGGGWVGFDFQKAFGRPVKVINDAAMQALGGYRGGRMLFLGLGTGLGSALIVDGVLEPMELAHLPYKHGKSFEDYVGSAALKRLGKKRWVKNVFHVVERLKNALEPEYVVLGGGNSKRLTTLPPGAIRGDNENAREGGFRLWHPDARRRAPAAAGNLPTHRTVRIAADAAALTRAAAEVYVAAARKAVAEKGRFAVALSGGSTPKALYSLLASDAELRSQVPWQETYFFFGDERQVPPGHPESNYRMTHEAMLSKAPVIPPQVFRIRGELEDADQAAAEYEQALREFFRLAVGQLPRFDLVMLGMGPDGHAASLFPGTGALRERKRLVTSNWVGKLYAHRITMTAPVLNYAALVMFMAHGQEKAQPLKAVLEGPYEPQQLPSQLIRPPDGTLLWLVDESAAALLDRSTIATCL